MQSVAEFAFKPAARISGRWRFGGPDFDRNKVASYETIVRDLFGRFAVAAKAVERIKLRG